MLPPEATAVQSASPELASEAPVPPVTPNAVEAAAGDATEALGIIESQGARQGEKTHLGGMSDRFCFISCQNGF